MGRKIQTGTKQLATGQTLLIIGIIFVAFNLRPAITAVGPLIGFIREDLQLSSGVAGLITTLPLLAFAALSFLAPKIGRKLGNELAILAGLLLLAVGIMVRSVGFSMLLFVGTAIAGVGIAICNVLLPGLVKQRFPEKVGLMTGVYTASLGGFAAIASGISVPLAVGSGLGWQKALLAWVLLAFVACLIWLPQVRKYKRSAGVITTTKQPPLLRSLLAWQVTLFIGLQSFLFYCIITWIPAILLAKGLDDATSGWMLSLLQLFGIPFSFFTPVLAARMKSQSRLVIAIGVIYIVAFMGLLFDGNANLTLLWILLIGIAQGAGFSLALTFFVLRTNSSEQASSLSGMAQSLGYLLAAVGPVFVGMLFDRSQSWSPPLITFIIITIAMAIAGLGASRGLIAQVKQKE